MKPTDRPIYRITITNREESIPLKPGFNLLSNFAIHKIPIQTKCGGKAICGLCRVKILEGQTHLSPVNALEINRLGEARIKKGWRLSCQSYAVKDVAVEIPEIPNRKLAQAASESPS